MLKIKQIDGLQTQLDTLNANDASVHGLGRDYSVTQPNDDLNDSTLNQFLKGHTATANSPFGSFTTGMNFRYSSTNGWQLVGSRGATNSLKYRQQSNGTWSAWKTIWDDTKLTQSEIDGWTDSLIRIVNIQTKADLNDGAINQHFKGTNGGLANPPTGMSTFVSGINAMYNDDTGAGGSGWQIATNRSSGAPLMIRKQSNGSWSGWEQIWDSAAFDQSIINNWSTAFGWGDHSTAGYLTTIGSHNHAASDITSGTFTTARIPTLAISKISGLQTSIDGHDTRITALENASSPATTLTFDGTPSGNVTGVEFDPNTNELTFVSQGGNLIVNAQFINYP